MAVFGFIVLLIAGFLVLRASFGLTVYTLGFTGRVSPWAAVFGVAGLSLWAVAVINAPFSLTLNG